MAANLLNTSNKKSCKSKEKDSGANKVPQADPTLVVLPGLPISLEQNLDCEVSKLLRANFEWNDKDRLGVDEFKQQLNIHFDMDCDSIVQEDNADNQQSHTNFDLEGDIQDNVLESHI